jgi:GNAT superfamily N-acetyltransferase
VSVRVVVADTPELVAVLGGLLTRYAHEQGWAHEQHHVDEVAALPGEYGPPLGRMLLALGERGEPLGCVLLRPIPKWCGDCLEMRRLYVVPEARRRGVARALIAAAECATLEAGLAALRFVTLPEMVSAQRLYERADFRITEPYRPSTAEVPVYMEKRLGP